MLFSKFERLVAKRYLRAKRKEGFISVITGFAFTGIVLGVATLIIVMSVMNGFRHELLGRILGINGHIGIMSPLGYPFNNYREAVKDLAEIEHVQIVIPMIENQLLISAGKSAEGAMVRGVAADDLLKKPILKDAFKKINMRDFRGDNIVMGIRLATKMGVVPGDTVTLISPNGKVTAFGTVPRMKSYQVIGTFEVGMYEYDSNFVFMPLETAQTYFGLKGAVTHIDVTLDDENLLAPVRRSIERSVSGDGAYVYDWKQTNAAFFNAIDVERNVMFIILTLIILVAAFNIITGLIMLVKDKGRDVAVLRTMGATKGMIMRIFFMDGAFIGVVGTALGLILGLLFCHNIEAIRQGLQTLMGRDLFSAEIYFLSKLPAKVDNLEVLTVVVISLLLSFLATLYPAYRAAKMDPVEALHRSFKQGGQVLEVLRGINLEIGQGEVVALIGPSGAGKSTLLQIAGLLEQPTKGEIFLDGQKCSKLGDAMRTSLRRDYLGFVYQYHNLLPEFDAVENVMMPLLIAGIKPELARVRAEKLLKRMGLIKRLKHRPAELSGGEQQRVAIARALANTPKLLLADEPTGNLDPRTSAVVFAELIAIVKETGLSALVATHNMELARQMDRIVYLQNGQLVEAGGVGGVNKNFY